MTQPLPQGSHETIPDPRLSAVVTNRRQAARVPLWAWSARAGAAVVLLCIGVAIGLFLRTGLVENEDWLRGQDKPETKGAWSKTAPRAKSQETAAPGALENLPANVQRNKGIPLLPPAEAKPAPPSAARPALTANPPLDPQNDCTFTEAGGKLSIALPAAPHLLPTWGGGTNSPRLLFDVEGDFTAQVRVGGDFTPAAVSAAGRRLSWIGAGLLLWVDESTFLRLERAGWYGRKPSTLYANWEVREDGRARNINHDFAALEADKTYLRLERRGKQILASYSEDGQSWSDVKPLDIDLPAKVQIGVVAGTTSSEPFTPTFDQFRLKHGPGEWTSLDNWLTARAAVAEKLPQPAQEQDTLSRLFVPGGLASAVQDGILRIPAGLEHTVATRQSYSGPLDITIQVRGPAHHDVSFLAPGGAMTTFHAKIPRGHVLNVRRPDAPRGDLGTRVLDERSILLPSNEWCIFHWQIRAMGMKVSINNQLLFQETARYDLTAEAPVRIRVNAATVEVKSVVVKELKE